MIDKNTFQKRLKRLKIHKLSNSNFCRGANLVLKLYNSPTRLSWEQDSERFCADDGERAVRFVRWQRYLQFVNGVNQRVNDLAKSYMLDHVTFETGDVLIDCGANIGELGQWAIEQGCDYIAIEPEQEEASCADANNPGMRRPTFRQALWNRNDRLKFYSLPKSADSSVIEMKGWDAVQEVDAVTLEKFFADNALQSIKLLKLEAEGAEPEILEGALPIINKVEFVAIDCGYERGKKQESTFDACHQILSEYKFKIYRSNIRHERFLYRQN